MMEFRLYRPVATYRSGYCHAAVMQWVMRLSRPPGARLFNELAAITRPSVPAHRQKRFPERELNGSAQHSQLQHGQCPNHREQHHALPIRRRASP